MDSKVTHDWRSEDFEAKARWFQSLTLEERANLLCEFTDIILEINPRLMEQKHAQPVEGRIQVLTAA